MTKTKDKPLPDLGAISPQKACEVPFEFELTHPVSGKLGVFFSVLGSESRMFKSAFRAMVNENIRLRREQPEGEPLPDEVAEKQASKMLAKITTAWRSGDKPVIVHNGKEMDFSEANAARLFQAEEWIRDQVEAEAKTLGNFMKD